MPYTHSIVKGMNDHQWAASLKKTMIDHGWVLSYETEEKIRFDFKDHPHHWMKDYDKKTRSFVRFDGNQRVNILCSKGKENDSK